MEEKLQDNRLPHGRDITGTTYLEPFDNLINQVPQDNEEYEYWLAEVLGKISHLPYPIDYLYDDLSLYKNDNSKIFVHFNAWSNYHFQICSNKRHLHLFEGFLQGHKIFKENEKAEEIYPGNKNDQQLYVKEYNRQIHNWSYKRLRDSITSKTAELRISIEFEIPPNHGSLQEKARDLIFFAYKSRINTLMTYALTK